MVLLFPPLMEKQQHDGKQKAFSVSIICPHNTFIPIAASRNRAETQRKMFQKDASTQLLQVNNKSKLTLFIFFLI